MKYNTPTDAPMNIRFELVTPGEDLEGQAAAATATTGDPDAQPR